MTSSYGPSTRATRTGHPEPRDEAPLLPGPTFAAPCHLHGDPAPHADGYDRSGNPTWRHLESAIGELEGGHAVAFASGTVAAAVL